MTEPFNFHTSIKLQEYVGRKAGTVAELLDGLRRVDGLAVFHHTYHFLYEHQYAFRQPPSDFAYWVGAILLDHGLAERLAGVNPVEFPTLEALRDRLIEVIEEHRKTHDCQTHAPDGMDFFFTRSNSFVVRTDHVATDLPSFLAALEKVSIGSIYHHMFEARLWREEGRNDFSIWLERELGLKVAAWRIERLEPYLMTLEEIRKRTLDILKEEGRALDARA